MLDNRRSDRIKLPQSLDARVGNVAVRLVDISPGGLQVHHPEALPPRGERVVVRFTWAGTVIELAALITWTTIHQLPKTTSERPLLSSGLRIESTKGDGYARMLAHYRDARAEVNEEANYYLFCELVNGAWRQTKTFQREQPAEGFTVSAAEDLAQVERLCAAYASGDSETRKLIRTLAALSIKKQETVGAAS